MKVIGTRYVQSKRKFTSEDYTEVTTRKPVYQFAELEKIVRSWPVTQKEQAE